MKLEIVPITLKEAKIFVDNYHRHHKSPVGHKFSIGCSYDSEIIGVVIVGRPVARGLDNGWTLEVTRCCTNGMKNVCSKLYSAAWRATRAMGYKKLITYILGSEKGTSVKASGWKLVGEAGGGSWNSKSRPRVDTHPLQKKLRYEIFN